MIGKCKCKHPGQDKLHGEGNRVLNHVPASNSNKKPEEYRCTVCGAVYDPGNVKRA